ncbi:MULTISPECIES: acyltransferase [Campylobacter]|uniref:acyltransferase n=1 Tax=Campylobacter TaxID=194 RepID=UPI000A2FABEE|nr:acyltransferase [Campylobacter sp. RM12175]ARR03833.1 maltose O-acyltransferase (MAT)-like acetyltransferase [Campylobacter sp. RM12175]MCR8689805.1 acyltransferase [Campylobacter sp. RM9264]
MLKNIGENDNIIYGDLSKQLNFKCDFKGKNNIVFFAGRSKNINIIFHSDNNLVFIGHGVRVNGTISLTKDCCCYIDDDSSFGGVSLRVYEAKNIIIGRDCMFSWSIWASTCDYHSIMDIKSNNRLNFSKSIYIGDHVWCGQEAGILKGSFIASGAVIGAKSMVVKQCYSNTINAGNPAKQIKHDIFWLRDDIFEQKWGKEETLKNKNMPNENFKYIYDKDEFISPKAIENMLNSLINAQDKLEFLYDAIYNNKSKNRFAYFDSYPYDISLVEYKKKFNSIKFKDQFLSQNISEPLNVVKEQTPKLSYGSAKSQILNSLEYRLGYSMIENSKSILGILKLPFVLIDIVIKYQKEQKIYKENIKHNPNLKRLELEAYSDYKDALRLKNHLSYNLGKALIQANKNWYKGGYIKFIFEVIKIKKDYSKECE